MKARVVVQHAVIEILLWWVRSIPSGFGVAIRRFVYAFFLKYGGNFRIAENVRIVGFGNTVIEDDVSIMANSYIYAQNGECILLSGTSINTNVQIGAAGGKVIVGRNALIGPNCVLRAADHNFDSVDVPIRFQGHKPGEIVIDDDVWLAANVVVTRDVHIGRGSVIGAGSVVTSDIPPMSIAFGVPAKVVRLRDAARSSAK